MSRFCCVVLVGVCSVLWLIPASCLLASELHKHIETLEPRSGAAFNIEITDPGEHFAAAILLQGGKGKIKIRDDGVRAGKKNFLIHYRDHFARKGLLIAVADAPKDRYGKDGMREGRFRLTKAHADDVAAVISRLRQITNKPIWLIGTSRGAISAVNAASRLPGGKNADGLVLTASVVQSARADYPTVFDAELGRIRLPVFVVHHEGDACPSSSYESVEWIGDELSSSKIAFKSYQGGRVGERKNRCNRLSHHGFFGIEETVINDIVEWVKATK